jgi:hypothetical protein
VKVRIKATPIQPEIDGVRLDTLVPGTIRDVSASIGSWLIAEGYAEPEMRAAPRADAGIGRRRARPLSPADRVPKRG